MNPSAYNWYMANIKALMNLHPGGVEWDKRRFKWIMIHVYELPNCFNVASTALLITTPSGDLTREDGFTFYLRKRLIRNDGKPTNRLHDNDPYNEYSNKGWSKLSYHFLSFQPNLQNPGQGHNIPELCKSLYNFLGNEDGIT